MQVWLTSMCKYFGLNSKMVLTLLTRTKDAFSMFPLFSFIYEKNNVSGTKTLTETTVTQVITIMMIITIVIIRNFLRRYTYFNKYKKSKSSCKYIERNSWFGINSIVLIC